MSSHESDREDLLREATALVERVELSVSSEVLEASTIVAGFRRDGALSLFFDADHVYQFNAAGKLRRAFADGLLYKAVHGRLVSLERVRTENEVQLLRRDLTTEQEQAFLRTMRSQLAAFAALLERGALEVAGQVPPATDVVARVQAWFAQHERITIAASPRV